MKFLLLSPTKALVTERPRGLKAETASGASQTMRSRTSFTAVELAQAWHDLPREDIRSGRFEASADKAALCWMRNVAVLVMEVDLSASGAGLDLDELEEALSHMAEHYASRYLHEFLEPDQAALAWTGRTLLLEAEEQPPEGWLGDGRAEASVDNLDGPSSAGVTASWGNAVISGCEALDEPAWRELVRGMVDAQALWREVSHIADDVASKARKRVVGNNRRNRQNLKQFLRDIDDLSTDLADHNLAADELKMVIQGNRQAAGRAWLNAWGYEDAVSRVERRLSDVENVAERRTARLDARYQGSVEIILLALGSLTLFEVALTAISAAYSGGVDEVPGAGTPFSVLGLLRSAHSELILLVAGVAILSGVLILLRSRRTS